MNGSNNQQYVCRIPFIPRSETDKEDIGDRCRCDTLTIVNGISLTVMNMHCFISGEKSMLLQWYDLKSTDHLSPTYSV